MLVRDRQPVGRGWTQPGGRPHAEACALAEAGRAARGACAYVTLEPCAHHGETAPCADALIGAGVARVVYAVADRDARVHGRGAARLSAAGVRVRAGVERAAAQRLNRGFFLRLEQRRPLFTAKLATTRAGASVARTRWITGAAARRCGHMLRAEHDAILVGRRTVERDRPRLTCRLPGMEAASPQAIVLDTRLRLSPRLALWRSARTRPLFVCHGPHAPARRRRALERRGVRLMECPVGKDARLCVRALAQRLAALGFTRVLLEGGAQSQRAFLAAGLVDELAWFRAPANGTNEKPAPLRRIFPPPPAALRRGRWRLQHVRRLDADEGRFYSWETEAAQAQKGA